MAKKIFRVQTIIEIFESFIPNSEEEDLIQ